MGESWQVCSASVLGTVEDYKLLEQMNKITLSKYAEMKNLSTAVGNSLQDLNDRCKFLKKWSKCVVYTVFYRWMFCWYSGRKKNEPRHKKTCLRGVKTQTGLLSYRD